MTVKLQAINPKRDGLLAGALIMAVAVAASIAVYISAESAMKQEIRSSLLGLAQGAANLVDVPKQQSLTKADQKGSDTYNAVMAPFKAMIAGDSNLADIYTMVSGSDGKIHFVVDTQVAGGQDTAGLMDVYDGASPVLIKAFQAQKAAVEDQPYSDKWGTVLSAYAPIYSADHTFLGMTGVDLRVDQYNKRLGLIREALLIGLVIALLCSAGCGYAVYALRKSMGLAEARSRAQQEQLAQMELDRLEAQAQGQRDAAVARRAAMNELAEGFEASVHSVLKEVVSAADLLLMEAEKVSVIAVDTRDRSQAVSRISNDAAQSSSQVAAASEELTASIREIRSQTDRSSQVVRAAADKGEVAKAVIERLSLSSGRIGEVVGVINEIASQINLLALNATIESARAGEAGKGFAVVANEVKSLSNQVSKALEEISHQIHDIQSETKQSVEAMNDILSSIADVNESTVIVASAVTEQSDVTREISQNIHATAHGAQEIASTMVGVLTSADETGVTAGRVRSATTRLQGHSHDLNQQVEAFLQKIRA